MSTSDPSSFLQQYVRSLDSPPEPASGSHPLDERILEYSLAGIYLLRTDEFLYVNRTLADMFGYSVEELVDGKSPLDLVAPADRRRVREHLRTRLKGDTTRAHYQFRGLTKEGQSFNVEVRGYALEYEGEPAVGGTLLEVTDRESAEGELSLFRELVDQASDALLSVSAEDGRILKINQTSRRMMAPEGGTLMGCLLPDLFPDLPAGTTWREMTRDLRDRDGLLLQSRCDPPDGEVFPAELHLQSIDGADGSIAVTARDISQRIGSVPSRTLSEKLLKQITENINQDFWMVDPQYQTYVYMNPSCRETWGDYFEGREDLTEAFLEAVHPEDRERLRRRLPEQKEGNYDVTYRIIRPTDGDIRWFRDRVFPVHDAEGRLVRIAGLGEDITDRKEIQRDLEESRRRFRQLAENIEATMFLYDLESEELLFVNSYYETMFGLEIDQTWENPLAFVDVVHPDDRGWVMERIQRFLEDPQSSPTDYEYRILDDDGEIHWLWTRWVPVDHKDGSIARVAGYTTDITQRKRTEEYLRTNERRLREMAENIEQVFYLVNEDYTESLYVNPIVQELWGVSEEALLEQPDCWLERVHPEDRDRVEGTLRRRVWEGLDESIQFEYRIVRPDGDVRWLRTVVSPVTRENGEPDRIVSVSEDITREKRISQNLEESLEETQTLLREVHHRVKNNLQVIVSLLGLQKRQFEDGEMKRILERCQNRIFSMALIHRKLYDTDRFTEVDFSEYVPDLVEDLLDAQIPEQTKITMEYDLETCPLDFDRLVPLGLVLSEVITNALEHAFEGDESGTIEVTSRRRKERLDLSVRDDGVGWSPDGPIADADSLGLKLLDSLIQKQLRGSVEFEQNGGTTVHFSIPLEPDY